LTFCASAARVTVNACAALYSRSLGEGGKAVKEAVDGGDEAGLWALGSWDLLVLR
jgi:hypothetical protein